MNKLHPGALWVFRFQGIIFFLVTAPMIITMLIVYSTILPIIKLGTFELFIIITAIVVIPLIYAEIYARMSYKRWFYEFGKTNLKTERGIIWKRYSNIPYQRVQNVDIVRGVFARMFGFSTIMVQTAGYSYGGRSSSFSEGYIPAVDVEEAEKIRTMLMKKISKKGI